LKSINVLGWLMCVATKARANGFLQNYFNTEVLFTY